MTGIEVHPTAYGPSAARALHGLIADVKRGDPLRPVTVVVPTNSVGVATRRLLASEALGRLSARGRGIAGLTILTVYRLGELLGAPSLAAAGRRPVSTPVLAAAVRRVLSGDAGIFRHVVDHPATEQSLVEAHRELSDCSPAILDALAATGHRAGEVVRVHRAVRDLLHAGWYDEADLMTAAEAAIHRRASVLDDIGHVVLYLPQLLSPAATRVVVALAHRTSVGVVAGFTGVATADADVHRTLGRIGAPAIPDPPPIDHPITVDRVISVSDAEEEVRTAVEHVLDAMRTDGTPAERIAVVYPSPEPYAAIVSEQFRAAGLAWNGPTDRATTRRFAARWLLDVLELPDRRFARSAVLNVLAGPADGASRQLPMALGTAERISRQAGVVDSPEGWIQRLTRLSDDLRDSAETHRTDGLDRWADHEEHDAERADQLRATVVDLASDLAGGAELTRWADLAAWAGRLLHTHAGTEADRAAWPDHEQQAADDVEAALDRIAALDAVEPSADLARLHRTLELELDSGLGRSGVLGHGVLVGRPSDTLGVDLDLVVVLGLAEGVFPSRPREDSLLAEEERAAVADELPPRHTRIHVQHRHLLAALTAARRRVLVYPRGDLRRSLDRAPSRWLLDAVEATTGRRELRDQDQQFVAAVHSFADRVRHGDIPPDDQAFNLRSLAAAQPDPSPPWLTAFEVGRRLLRARSGGAFTPFDGNLADVAHLVLSPAADEQVTSPSALQAWVACPHAYLARYVLKIREVDDPEERMSIAPAELGLLVHQILEDWIQEQIEAGLPDPATPWSPRARDRLLALMEERAAQWEAGGLTGHPRLWEVQRETLRRELTTFLDDDDETRRRRGSTPMATELPFGPGRPNPPLALPLGDGRTAQFAGIMDRVDRTADGGVVVTDYKTGSPRRFAGIGPDDLVGDGSHLQLLVYGLAARQLHPDATSVHAEYLFTREQDAGTRIGYAVDDEGRQVLAEVVRFIVDQIEAGVFPQRPAEPVFHPWTPCQYCDPDELGTADRYRRWERLRELPDLRAYLEWVEPTVDAELDPVGVGRGST